jgi:hypothetical protein
MCDHCRQYHNNLNKAPGGPLERQRAARRAKKLDANLANQAARGVELHSEAFLGRISREAAERIAGCMKQGNKHFVNVYTYTIESAKGYGATDDERDACAKDESTGTMRRSPNPLIRVETPTGWRNIRQGDVWAHNTGAHIVQLAISPNVTDVSYIEQRVHQMLTAGGEVVGFKGHNKDGGTPQQDGEYMFGVAALILPRGLQAMGIAVRDDCVADFEAAQMIGLNGQPDGRRREGARLPAMPSVLVKAPKGSGGEFLLGGAHMHLASRSGYG